MRRMALLAAVCLVLATAAQAQIGKQVGVRAGTAEDRFLAEINRTQDPAERLALLEEFLEEFAGQDVVLLAYEMLVAHYAAAQDHAKAYEYGEKALEVDPENFQAALNLFRIAQEQNDTEKMYGYGERIGGMVERYKARPRPEGMPEELWEQKRRETLEEAAPSVQFVELSLFNAAYQVQDPAQRAALLERFLKAYPDSAYADNAQTLVAATYQMTRQYDQMLDFGRRILERDPENYGMLLLLADYWSESGTDLAAAEQSATKALELIEAAVRPEHFSEEQWQQHIRLRHGLAHSILGQVYINRRQHARAVEAFQTAGPMLKGDTVTYARNLYRLGFTLAQMRRTAEARAALQEAIALESPYKALAQQTLDTISGTAPRKRP